MVGPDGGNILWYVPFSDPQLWHLLLQAGADVHHKDKDEKIALSEFVITRKKLPIALMLLGSGSDVGNIYYAHPSLRSKLHEQVKKWLLGFDAAKKIFKRIFDNEELEKELCDFILNEK